MRGTLEVCLSMGLALPHYCATVQEGPFEKRGDDSQRLDNSNAMVHDDMNPLVLSYSHL